MQAYRVYYDDGRVVPLGNPTIPEGSELIITVLEPPAKNHAERQREAFRRFMKGMDDTPPLPPEFDEIVNLRVNIKREADL
jgi:hypothetical protein